MEKYSDTISKGRVRVFYKGRNRNGTYITDDFAQKLIQSAPYAPIKGIYSAADGDFADHGKARTEGRIYGVVPAEPNFAWEWHMDEDGKEREYACFDVLYYTALYSEAAQIDGKSQSMELYKDTLKGSWKVVEGKKTYVFTEGCFLGLQTLGDDVTPCFEGASFYTEQDDPLHSVNIEALLEKYEHKANLFQYHDQGGKELMEPIFKLSDNQKYNFLFALLNPNCNEAGNWKVDYGICDVYDDYAVVCSYIEQKYERVYYTKDDATDSLEITSREPCYIIDVNENEKKAIESFRGETTYEQAYAAIAEKDSMIAALTSEKSECAIREEEYKQQIAALAAGKAEICEEYENVKTKIAENETAINTLTNELNNLKAYKKNVEDNEKKAVIETYAEQLPENVITEYLSNLDRYTAEELDKELTYEQKKANPVLFSKNITPVVTARIPKEEGVRTITDILERYERH